MKRLPLKNYKKHKQSDFESSDNNAAMLVQKMFKEGLHQVLPFLYEATSLLATIPATSCSAERSFSGLRRLKTYLRSTMGQERPSHLGLLNIERVFSNEVLKGDMDEIIDTFAHRKNRDSYFFGVGLKVNDNLAKFVLRAVIKRYLHFK